MKEVFYGRKKIYQKNHSAVAVLPARRVFNTCKWNNMAETAELRLFLCQVYKNLMLYGVVFHVKQWYNGGYETLV